MLLNIDLRRAYTLLVISIAIYSYIHAIFICDAACFLKLLCFLASFNISGVSSSKKGRIPRFRWSPHLCCGDNKHARFSVR